MKHDSYACRLSDNEGDGFGMEKIPVSSAMASGDRLTIAARLRALCRISNTKGEQIFATGVSQVEFENLVYADAKQTDSEFKQTLEKLTKGLALPIDYLLNGVTPKEFSTKKTQTLNTSFWIEKFSIAQDLKGDSARRFYYFAMNHFKPRLNVARYGMNQDGLPQSVDDITGIYANWKKISTRNK